MNGWMDDVVSYLFFIMFGFAYRFAPIPRLHQLNAAAATGEFRFGSVALVQRPPPKRHNTHTAHTRFMAIA